MSGAYTPGTVPTAPYGWNQQISVSPASPYTPQPECELPTTLFFSNILKVSYLI